MQKRKEQLMFMSEHILPWLVLLILLFYTYVRFFENPYSGFKLDLNGRIVELYIDNPEQSVKLGDRLLQVDGLNWDDFRENLRRPLYTHIQPGQVVNLQIERGGQQKEIEWVIPVPRLNDVLQLVFSQNWMAYIFWFFGTVTLFLMRPKDERWRLMIAFNYLTAIWVVVGSISFYHLRESAVVLRMVVWLCVPVYLHLNWVFLKSFSKLPAPLMWGGYGLAGILSIAEWFQILNPNHYYWGFLLAVGGSAVLIILHAILQREIRRNLRLFIFTVLIALLLPIVFGLISTIGSTASALYGGAAIFSLPLLPLGYFYASYRHQLGNLEIRINRFISLYLFLMLLGVGLFPAVIVTNLWPEAKAFVDAGAILLIAVVSIVGFPSFQAFVEQRILGIHLPQVSLQQTYAARITTSMSLLDLQNLMKEDILPSLLVRQFISLEFDEGGALKLFFAVGVTDEQSPDERDIAELVAISGKPHPFSQLAKARAYSWVRLVLPLKVGEKLIGLWLFGRRDPDDLYSQSEIPILQSLADQTAIAQTNLIHTERLKRFYMADIDRHELERQNLAHELHDNVLHEMANLMTNPEASLPPSFQDDYDKLVEQIRKIIGNLRPPILNYGLELTLDDFGDNLAERANGTVNITVEIQTDGSRYPQNIEQHIYRIVQEACENAMRHAKATNIRVSGRLNLNEIILTVADDGIGFKVEEDLNLDSLLANKHFGLAGMRERAELIGARVSIHSSLNTGTSIQILWADDSIHKNDG